MASLADIGSALAAHRAARGLTQRALAGTLGVKQPQIARWEATGYRTASLERVSAAAEALGIDVGSPLPLAAEAQTAYAPTTPAAVADQTAARALARLGVSAETVVAFCRSHGIREMALFGSAVRTDFDGHSDVDVLVSWDEHRKPATIGALDDIEAELRGIFRRRADLVDRALGERDENFVRRSHILNGARTVYVAR